MQPMFLLTDFNLELILEPEIPPVAFTKLKLKISGKTVVDTLYIASIWLIAIEYLT